MLVLNLKQCSVEFEGGCVEFEACGCSEFEAGCV